MRAIGERVWNFVLILSCVLGMLYMHDVVRGDTPREEFIERLTSWWFVPAIMAALALAVILRRVIEREKERGPYRAEKWKGD